jgi:hypothetical protein
MMFVEYDDHYKMVTRSMDSRAYILEGQVRTATQAGLVIAVL